MKLFLGLALLIGGFALVLVWRERTIDASLTKSPVSSPVDPATPGWAEIRVGRFSGAPPADAATPPVSPAAAMPTTPSGSPPPAAAPTTPEEQREFEVTVQHGQTLSEICRAHYKTARVKLVEALAKHNGLRDAGALREGTKLRLPPIETLEPR